MFFLLIHPFIDRNGRVVRGLLDYYNEKLKLNRNKVWRERGFSTNPVHKDAFRIFFEHEAKLPPRKNPDPYPISDELRPHLGQMADYMINWAACVRAMLDEQTPDDPFEMQRSVRRLHITRFKQLFS
jgi:hypothetical protein